MYYAIMGYKGPAAYKLVYVGPDEKVVGLHILGLGNAEKRRSRRFPQPA